MPKLSPAATDLHAVQGEIMADLEKLGDGVPTAALRLVTTSQASALYRINTARDHADALIESLERSGTDALPQERDRQAIHLSEFVANAVLGVKSTFMLAGAVATMIAPIAVVSVERMHPGEIAGVLHKHFPSTGLSRSAARIAESHHYHALNHLNDVLRHQSQVWRSLQTVYHYQAVQPPPHDIAELPPGPRHFAGSAPFASTLRADNIARLADWTEDAALTLVREIRMLLQSRGTAAQSP